MPLLPRIIVSCCLALSAILNAAPEPVDLQAFAGTWKENFAKSHQRPLYPVTYTFTRPQRSDDTLQLLSESQAFPNAVPAIIHFDGKDYPKPGANASLSTDDTMTWTEAPNNRAFDVVYKHKGEWAGSVHWTLSPDGKTLNVENRTQRDEHAPATITICERASGGPPRDSRWPLVGVWKSVAIRGTVPWTTRYEVTPAGELRYTNVQTKLTYTAKPDGKEYASSLAGVMVKLQPADGGPRSIRKTFVRGGQTVSESVLAVSADGRTLTDTTPAARGETEPGVQTFDRQ